MVRLLFWNTTYLGQYTRSEKVIEKGIGKQKNRSNNKNIKNAIWRNKNISNKKNIRVELIDLTIKNKILLYCDELPFGILSFCSYLNIETMNIISSDMKVEQNN